MIKCLFRENLTEKHCDKEADYIMWGKSYCAPHLKIRDDEMTIAREEEQKRESELLKKLDLK